MPALAAPSAVAAPVGQGFNLNPSDLRFILKQIKISEQHAVTATAANPCGTLLGSGPDQIPNAGQGVELPWGLRTVDGSCNNLIPGQSNFGTADQDFPRLVPKKLNSAESGSTYDSSGGTVTDSQPRVISNLVVDQTVDNPAAVAAAGENPVVTPSGAFFIPNVATDVGLSAPYNSWFTLFGQFFDHGLDLVHKGGNGAVFVPLKTDDPLFVPNAPTNFMVLTRATHDGDHEATNETSPFVDQSQTYTSHPSHQVFLREYANDADGKPQATGGLITGPGGGMADWSAVKEQARTLLGIELSDVDALSVPLLATDPYGRFLRGPNGFPQIVTTGNVLVEGNPAAPVTTANAVPAGHAFLDDINHNAVPLSRSGATLAPDGDTDVNGPAPRPSGTYDDEMLAAHFIAGDGRVNENIGLTAVHHVFHSEHNRLVDESDGADDPSDIKTVIRNHVASAAAAGTTPMFTLADWQRSDGEWNGERLFQAARFVTEMEYQHLAFEEFARKVQPAVNPFGEGGTGYNTTINPAIRAEFAHAVYRFGHSMLTESVDRVSPTGARSDIPLLQAFLNPPAFMTGTQTPEQAAGNIIRGMTRQVGNELDEFVTEALRNQLLGLPLDLATLNLARARDTGIPSLNEARRAFYAESNNSALTPYESWADLSFSLKHPASLVNLIAAYGTHDSVTAATTLDGKRAAANALVYGTNGPDGELGTPDDSTVAEPEDRYAFLNGVPFETTDPDTGVTTTVHTRWVNGPNGVTKTGVDTIDLWVGGLAEKQMVFGGLLGPTFNYVFEAQMEDLQFGDRFYYLSRTAGLNLLTQLEGNSFAELIQRNTDVSSLPADSFSRPDLVFDVAKLGTSGPILDDDATDYNESTLLTRTATGVIRYGGPAHVVFNGSAGNDKVQASEGDDTIRGNDGDDWMQGGDGADNLIGGLGDDTLLDLFGDDVLKGGDGNDTLSSGQGFGGDLNQGGRGNDFIVVGNDLTETFAGPGDDFVLGGDGDDTHFGDDGDDWLEGGGGAFNLIQGDNGAPFQDDPNEPGHDVLIGYGGESDYDAEGGDDIMLAGPGIQRSEGMLGFDWVTHKADPSAADSDMNFVGALPPGVETNRDRFDLVESLSGWDKDDILRGDDRDAAAMVDHELNAAGTARISGLAALLGATSFTGGNIILGGAGSDLIEGRGGDDVIDGDAFLNVRLSVRDAADASVEIDSVDTLAGVQARVLAGTVNPGQIRIVREILTPANGTAVDTVVFSEERANYDITVNDATGVTTVVHARGSQADGTDRLRNVENMAFAAATVTSPDAPTIGTAVAGNASATANWTPPANDGGAAISEYQIQVLTGTTVVQTVTGIPGTTTSGAIPGLTNGTAYTFSVLAVNAAGAGALSAASNAVTPTAPVVATRPGTPTIGTASAGNASATVRWTAPASDGGAAITGYRVRTFRGTTFVKSQLVSGATATSVAVTRLTNGTSYNFTVSAINEIGASPASARSNAVTPTGTVTATRPGTPTIGTASAGNASATVRWTAPASDGGAAITQYRVQVRRGTTVVRTVTGIAATATSTVVTGLTNGTSYNFRVSAVNSVGTSNLSAASNAVTPTGTVAATRPGAPTIGTAVAGAAGGAITATATWAAPTSTGGSAISGYRVFALRMSNTGTVLATTQSAVQPATARSLAMTLPVTGNYRFQVVAINAIGSSNRSARSNLVAGR